MNNQSLSYSQYNYTYLVVFFQNIDEKSCLKSEERGRRSY